MRVAHLSISAVRHTLGAATEALLVASLIAMAAIAFSPVYAPARSLTHADTAFAAKGGSHGGNLGSTAASIVLDQAGQTLALGSSVTFTSTVVGLMGNEYALVYLKCVEGGTTVYGQLDLPGTTFVLGGGSSPWWQVGGQASCVGYLQAYGSHAGLDTIRTLAQTLPFTAN